jgi:hypothetical protein
MAYGDIPDLDFTVDENGNVTYGSGPKPAPKPATTSEKKWWEQVIGVVPALVTAIFGGNAQAQQPVYTTSPPTQNSGISTTNILIIGIAVIAMIFLFTGNKRK